MNTKICNKCKIEKPISDFSVRNIGLDNRPKSQCKLCYNQSSSTKRTPEQNRIKHFKDYYGIDIEVYNNLYKEQEGKCKICGEFFEKLNLDHCHKENIVRGLLCFNCNTGLGFFKDNPILLQKAIEALIRV